MRPITKVFLLIVVAFVVYLLWPHKPNIKGFDPGTLAKLQVQEWQAEKAGRPMSAWWTRFRIYTSQYDFPPVAAFRIAQSEGSALSRLRPTEISAATGENPEVKAGFLEKFALMKRSLDATFDAESLAQEELTWRTSLIDGASADQMVGPVTHILAGLYGGAPEDFGDVAANVVSAQELILGSGAPVDGLDPAKAAQAAAQEGYKLLKEIAEAPAPAGTAQEASN